ncbi:MAG TPA: UDP-N-acetylglucosamine--N-acetylmuramyl-(pentapeptide) pyrophosphoryl-undecaprenol N-acetylglucosamine transferase [Acidimicrobiales bacterium]
MSGRRGIVIAGGGTGGHIVPSLQIARALVARGHTPATIELYGSRRGQEATLWPTLEFPFTLLPGRGIRRSVSPSALWANLGAVVGLVWACVRAVSSFLMRRPRVVVGVGGYASFPAGLAAVLTRTPLVLLIPDAVPGAVNRVFCHFARANAVAFPGTGVPRATVTGAPVRPELASIDRSATARTEARAALGLPADRQTVAAFGGSLGALRINRSVLDLAGKWVADGGRSLYQVTGRRDFEQFQRSGPDGQGSLFYKVVPFEDQMPTLMVAADVCVSRAGANTVAELLLAGAPAILVPLPGAPQDHQTRNAQAVVDAGAAVLLPDGECNGDRLDAELNRLLADPDRLVAMSEAARALGRPDAAASVAELVDAHAR